jgi:hypothetical protein
LGFSSRKIHSDWFHAQAALFRERSGYASADLLGRRLHARGQGAISARQPWMIALARLAIIKKLYGIE